MFEVRLKVQGDLDLSPEIEKFISDFAEGVRDDVRRVIDESTPRGRLYRRGAITARRTRTLERLGFKNRGKTRSVVGSRFHRASAPGQPPAKDTGKLYRNIKIVKKGKFEKLVRFDAPYSAFVEETRPFIEKAIDLTVQRFL